MATAIAPETKAPAVFVPHLAGCPVKANPTNEELAARVEVYSTYPPVMDTREGRSRAANAIVVTHCHECGAMTHQR